MRCALCGLVFVIACGEVSSRADGPPGDGGPATITLTTQLSGGAPANIEFVAYQDGDGPWQVVTGNAGVYTLTVTSGRYGLVTACERTGRVTTFVDVGFFAVDDGAARFALDSCTPGPAPRVRISGTTSNMQSTERVFISTGASSFGGLPNGDWSMDAIAGPGTLVALRTLGDRPLGMLFQRPSFAEGATFALNFGAQIFPAESTLTLDPTGVDPFITTTYIDESGRHHRIDIASGAVPTYRVVPAELVGNGISLLTYNSGTQGSFRTITRAFKSPVAQTLTLPPAFVLAAPPQFVAMTPYPIAAVTVPVRSGASYYQASYFSSGADQFHSWDVTYSAAWLGAATSFESRFPDFSALAGWKASYGMIPADFSTWTVSVVTGPVRLQPGAAAFGVNGISTAPMLDGDETTLSQSGANF